MLRMYVDGIVLMNETIEKWMKKLWNLKYRWMVVSGGGDCEVTIA